MATIKEIAKLANVSIATVSNVLNQKPGSASPEKVEKVLKVAKSLNYRPNYLARASNGREAVRLESLPRT